MTGASRYVGIIVQRGTWFSTPFTALFVRFLGEAYEEHVQPCAAQLHCWRVIVLCNCDMPRDFDSTLLATEKVWINPESIMIKALFMRPIMGQY